MPVYYHTGNMLLLHVPMEMKLTEKQKSDLRSLFITHKMKSPPNWSRVDGCNVDADYKEIVSGYAIEDHTSRKNLSDVFQSHEPVPQEVDFIEKHQLYDQVKDIAPNASLIYCKVSYVSIE